MAKTARKLDLKNIGITTLIVVSALGVYEIYSSNIVALETSIESLRQELKTDMNSLRQEMKDEIKSGFDRVIEENRELREYIFSQQKQEQNQNTSIAENKADINTHIQSGAHDQ